MAEETEAAQRAARPYRGHDRRGLTTTQERSTRWPFVLAGLVLLTILVITASVAASGGATADGTGPLDGQLAAVAAALALVAGALGIVRWRMTVHAPSLLTGVGVIVFGAATVGLGQLLPQIPTPGVETAVLGWVRPASLVVSFAFFGWAVRSPDIDVRLRPAPMLLLAFGATTALTVLLQLVPALSAVVAGAADALPAASTSVIAPAFVAAAWVGLATVYSYKGLRARRLLFAWYGLLMYGLACAEVMRALGPVAGETWATGGALMRVAALMLGVVAATRELQAVFGQQSDRLFHTTVASMDSEARMRAELAKQEERAHEARNALAAIEGATVTLERFRDTLDPDTRRTLTHALTGEITRLQRLVSGQQHTVYRIAFRLVDVLEPQFALVRSQGLHVLADVSDELFGYGRPADVAEVVQNLLLNARRHAPGSPVLVRATSEGAQVVVRIEDRGPGVPEGKRAAIFERGGRASDAPGSGLGLYVSAQLMREMGGSLELDQRPGAGAVFAVRMPSGAGVMSESGAGLVPAMAQPVYQVDEGGGVGDIHGTLDVPHPHGAGTRASGRLRQPDDDVGDEPLRQGR